MRPDFFLVPDRVARLRAVCESWLYTPFRQRSHVKGPGGGVDCAYFVSSSFLEAGAVDEQIAVPHYDLDYAEHNVHSLLRDWFEQPKVRERIRRVDEEEPHLDGDMVFPEIGQCVHHIAIRIGNVVYNVWRPAGVQRMAVSQLKLARSRYRIMEAAS
jgi:hypothetical protein